MGMDSIMDSIADVVFVIEGTAIMGAYINELKNNYIQPTLEYFSSGPIDEYLLSDNATKYAIVLYRTTSDLLQTISTYGPFSSPRKVMDTIEHLPLHGGGMDSCANMAEGFATAHCCFDDMKEMRARSMIIDVQRHCILICNSPPYSMPVIDNDLHVGKTVCDLVCLFHERKINLSIMAPRKIPVLIKLFMKADTGGDQPFNQTQKNYAKNIRHLVLLRGYHLKERPPSPNVNAMIATQQQQQTQMNPQQNQVPPQQAQQLPTQQQLQSQQQQQPQAMEQTQTSQPPHPVGPGMTMMNQQQIGGVPGSSMNPNPQQQAMQQAQQQQFVNQVPNQMQNPNNFQPGMAVNAQNRWVFNPNQAGSGIPPQQQQQQQQPRPPFMGPSGPLMNNPNNQNMPAQNPNSALISQLSAPPNQMNPLLQQQQQQQHIRMQMLQNQQQLMSQQQAQMNQQQQINQQQNQLSNQAQTHSQQQQQQPQQQPQQQQTNMQMGPVSSAGSGLNQSRPPPHQNQIESFGSTNGNDRTKVWTGLIEWSDKSKHEQGKLTRTVPFAVWANIKEGEPEIKADSWPAKLIMQLMPKHLVGHIGSHFLKDSKMVWCIPTPCEALDPLIKVMLSGYAGCVHFSALPGLDLKVLLLLYTPDKNAFLGFIPNNQPTFVDRLRKVIQQKQQQHPTTQSQQQPQQSQQMQVPMSVAGGVGGGPGVSVNTGGGMLQQNALPPNMLSQQPQQKPTPMDIQQMQQEQQQQQQQQHFNQYAQQMAMQIGPVGGQMGNASSSVGVGGVGIGGPNQMGGVPMQHQQQMTMLQQQQQQQQQQRMAMIGPNAQQMQQMPPHALQQQRMIRPMMTNNPGLRHLLQQQSTPGNQFRPQMGNAMSGQMGGGPPNQMGGAGGPMGANRPFDDANFEFM